MPFIKIKNESKIRLVLFLTPAQTDDSGVQQLRTDQRCDGARMTLCVLVCK